VLAYLLKKAGFGKSIVGGGAYIIVRASWVKDVHTAKIHRFYRRAETGTAKN
jgi:hypothetical protein